MSEAIPMTRTGYNKIKAEMEHLEQIEMPKIAARVAAAREEGDLSENAEYHGARETQGMMQAKINMLKDKLVRATIIDTSRLNKSEVAFSATVKVKDLDYDDEEEFTLVGAGEDDPDQGRILVTSPIGSGLLGAKVGQVVEIAVPKGTVKFEVLEIRYDD
ncbi:MAG: transcription elongation factor GreA [Pirellulaceae bacterium]